MAWQQNPLNLSAEFPLLRHKEAYQDVLDFLNDQVRVNSALNDLKKMTAQYTSSDAFNQFLSRIEAHLGFNATAIQVQEFLTPQAFLTYVQAGIPLIDVGAGSKHGYVTHRVQMILISIAFDGDSVHNVKIVDLYKNLANPNSWQLHDAPQVSPATKFFTDTSNPEHSFVQNTASRFTLLWDRLFDVVSDGRSLNHCNACCPEFLHDIVAEPYGLGVGTKWS